MAGGRDSPGKPPQPPAAGSPAAGSPAPGSPAAPSPPSAAAPPRAALPRARGQPARQASVARRARQRRVALLACGLVSSLVLLFSAAAWSLATYANGSVGRIFAGTSGEYFAAGFGEALCARAWLAPEMTASGVTIAIQTRSDLISFSQK